MRFKRRLLSIKKQAEFRAFYQSRPPSLKKGPIRVYWVRKDTAQDYARLGIVVPKKLVGNAVSRNLVKRMARVHFRNNFTKLQSMDIIVSVRSSTKNISRIELHGEIEKAFEILLSKQEAN